MGLLAPLFLLAGLAALVPLVLHLFHRHDPRRRPFPALRYLRRAEKEHARSIRLRQLLLLFLRMGVVFLLVLAGARLYLRSGSGAHDPTALAIVLDNSLSSGWIRGERRVLDELKERALEALELAGPEDRIWIVLAGSPDDPALPLSPAEARLRVRSAEPTPGAGDLVEALERAATLAAGSELPAREVHLLSDLQATAFPGARGPRLPEGLPVLAFRPDPPVGVNRTVSALRLGGGLPPLAGERTEMAVRVDAFPPSGEPDSVPVRLVLDDEIREAALVVPGSSALLPLGPFGPREVWGRVELDPDALRADDRRYFAFRVRPPTPVALGGTATEVEEGHPLFFVERALDALEEGGRILRVAPGEAEVLLAPGGAGLESLPARRPVVILPPGDPAMLPALNRRLAGAGIPWELEPAPTGGEARIVGVEIPVELEGLTVRRHYRLAPRGEVDGRVLAALSTGGPLLVSGEARDRPYLLLASALDPDAGTLPVSAAMVPFLDWTVAGWPGADGILEALVVGDSIPLPRGATHLATPDGTRRSLERTEIARDARATGIYTIFRGDSVLERVAVNTPPSESRLEPVRPERLEALVGPGLRIVRRPGAWPRSVFTRRQGPELWRPLLLAALLLLLLESWIAASGRERSVEERETRTQGERVRA